MVLFISPSPGTTCIGGYLQPDNTLHLGVSVPLIASQSPVDLWPHSKPPFLRHCRSNVSRVLDDGFCPGLDSMPRP